MTTTAQTPYTYQSGSENFYWNAIVARDCGRYRVLTKNTYSRTVMKEADKAVMAEFMDNVKLIIATMSYDVFSPVPEETNRKQYLFCESKSSGAKAKGFVSTGGFTVLKGSVASNRLSSFFTGNNYYKLRLRLEEEGIILDRVFQRDYEFSAPSAASAVILGRTSNGNVEWRTEDGVSLRDIQTL